MSHGEAETPSAAIARQVAELRKFRGWNATQFADELTKAGFTKWDRFGIRNIEEGKRKSISVEELYELAYVLGVAPIHLLVPVDRDEAKVTPQTTVETGRLREWIRGNTPFLTGNGDAEQDFGRPEWITYLSHMPGPERARLLRDRIGSAAIADSMDEAERQLEDSQRRRRQVEEDVRRSSGGDGEGGDQSG